jgi:hypothetical protein
MGWLRTRIHWSGPKDAADDALEKQDRQCIENRDHEDPVAEPHLRSPEPKEAGSDHHDVYCEEQGSSHQDHHHGA